MKNLRKLFLKAANIFDFLIDRDKLFLYACGEQKRFNNRETIAALNYDMQQMSSKPALPSMQLKQLTLFLLLKDLCQS